MELYIAALTLGILGSFHCIGMCGPIAVALPVNNESWLSRIFGGSLYNFGRALTYALMGAIFGLVGQGLNLVGLQQVVSISIGVIMMLSVVFPLIFKQAKWIDEINNKVVGGLKRSFSKLFQKRSNTSLLLIGILNGFLPCGLVYMAIAGAIATGDLMQGSIYMFLFGVATLPIMLSLTLTSQVVSLGLRNKIRKVIPVFIVIIGLLFVLRGMNLGIKYVSPKFSNEDEQPKMECCH